MADSGGNKPPDRGSQSTSGKVDTKPKKAEITQQTTNAPSPTAARRSTADSPSGQGKESHSTSEVHTKPEEAERTEQTSNVSSPDPTVTGRSTADDPSGQDEHSKSAEGASGSLLNVPGENTRPKEQNKEHMETTGETSTLCTERIRSSKYVQYVKQEYEPKCNSEQRNQKQNEKKLTEKPNKLEIKTDLQKSLEPETIADKLDNEAKNPKAFTSDEKDFLKEQKLDKGFKDPQMTGAGDGQQAHTSHPDTCRETKVEDESIKTEVAGVSVPVSSNKSASMQIYVTKLDKEKITLDVGRNDSVKTIKAMIKNQSFMKDNWCLHFGKEKLEDENKTLAEYNIEPGSSLITLLLRKKGKKLESVEGRTKSEGQESKTGSNIQPGEAPAKGAVSNTDNAGNLMQVSDLGPSWPSCLVPADDSDEEGEEHEQTFQNDFDESIGNPTKFTKELVQSKEILEGLDLELECVVSKPGLKAEWLKDGNLPEASARITKVSEGVTHSLCIKEVSLKDSGEYSVSIDEVKSTSTVNIKGIPSAPKNLDVCDITTGSCKLCWEKPENDGGSSIKEYIVRMREVDTEKWTTSTCVETEWMIKNLKESTKYTFSVAARNNIGTGKSIAKTGIETQWSYRNEGSMTVKSGETVLLEIKFKGQKPRVRWLLNGDEHPDKNRTSYQIKNGKIVFQFDKVVPCDKGKYTLTAENRTGSAVVIVLLNVIDKPSPPNSLTVSDVTSEACHLHWQKPDHENGSSITKYTVQMCVNGEKDWKDTGSSTTTDIVVTGLQKGREYFLRVAAENEAGTGAFVQLSVPVTTEDSSGSANKHAESDSESIESASDDDKYDTNVDQDTSHEQTSSVQPPTQTISTDIVDQATNDKKSKGTTENKQDKDEIELSLTFQQMHLGGDQIDEDEIMKHKLEPPKDHHTYYKKEIAETPTVLNGSTESDIKKPKNEYTAEASSSEVEFKQLNISNVKNEVNFSKSNDKSNILSHSLKGQIEDHASYDKSDIKGLVPSLKRPFEEEHTCNNQHESSALEVFKQNESPEVSLDSYDVISDSEIKETVGAKNSKEEIGTEGTAKRGLSAGASGFNKTLKQAEINADQKRCKSPLSPKISADTAKEVLPVEASGSNKTLEQAEMNADQEPRKSPQPQNTDSHETRKIKMLWKSHCTEEIHTMMCDPEEYVIFKWLMLQNQVRTLPVSNPLCKHFENLEMENNIVRFNWIGDEEMMSKMSEELYKIILSKAPGLSSGGMPFSGLDITQAERHIETLNKGKRECLHFELFPDTELLYYVCKTEHNMQVQQLLSNALKIAKAESDGYANEERDFEMVVGKIFDKKHLKDQVQSKYPNVKFNYRENLVKNRCDCTFKGKKCDLEKAVEFVETLATSICYAETGLAGLKENKMLPSLINGIDEFLQHETKNSDDMFYFINRVSSKIGVAALGQPKTDEIINKVRKWIRSEVLELQVSYEELKTFIEFEEKGSNGRVKFVVENDHQLKLYGSPEYIKKIKRKISLQEGYILSEKKRMPCASVNSPIPGADVQDKMEEQALKRTNRVEQFTLVVDKEKVSDCRKTIHDGGLNIVNSYDVTEWNFAAGHAFLMINGKTSDIQADFTIEIYIDQDITETSQRFSGDVATIRVPRWTNRDKDKHNLCEDVKKALSAAKEKRCSRVCVICKNVARWPANKFACGTLHPIREFFMEIGNQPTSVEMICDDQEQFHELVEINRRLMHGVLEDGEKSNRKIDVVIGSLCDQKVDVIVNTTGTDLKLDNGAVSKSILNKAGKQIQKECNSSYPYGIKPWGIAETLGYKMKCKKVLHGALEEFSVKAQSLEKMKTFIGRCIEFAQDKQFKSIAFPAIGTGVLAYPVDSVADIMFEIATEFIQQEECTLEKVIFVIHDNDDLGKSVFEKKRERAMAYKQVVAEVDSKFLMKINIDGKQNDVDLVKETLQQFGHISLMTLEPDALKADEAVGGCDVEQRQSDVNEYEVSQKRNVELTEDKNTECFVFVKNIQKGLSYESIWKDMIKPGFPVRPPKLIYHPLEKDALLICNSKADATELCKLGRFEDFIFEPHKPCLQVPFMKLDIALLQSLASEQKYEEFSKKLKDIRVNLCRNGLIQACTTYQLRVVKHIICFSKSIETTCKTIENVSEDIWTVVSLAKQLRISEFTENGGHIQLENGKVHLTSSNQNLLTDIHSILQTYVKSLLKRDVMELKINSKKQSSAEDVKKWCSEIEDELKQECCVYNPKTNSVLAYCTTYETNLKVKHLLRVKQGDIIIKPTARGKRFAKESKNQEEPDKTKETNVQVRDVREKEFFQTKEGIKVYVYVANILNLDVDCIVNAANDRLQHGGGVAAVIQRGAGYALEKASQEYVSRHGKLKAGQACTTTAGKLRYSCVVHAVGPCWSDYYPHNVEKVNECKKDLIDAITNSFLEAERNDLKSIALPAISSAIFGVPEKLCIYHYVKATVLYSGLSASKSKKLKEIHFIDKNKKIIEKIRYMFEEWLGRTGSPPDFDTNEFISRESVNTKENEICLHDDKVFPEVVSGHLPKPMSYEIKWKTIAYLFCGVDDLKIIATSGNIFDTRASAIVTTINEHGGYGYLGREISKKVCSRSVAHYKSQLAYGLRTNKYIGGVIITHGYDCGYDYIIHVVFSYHAREKSLKKRQEDIENTYWNVFCSAYLDKNISSVVLPLIGIGKGQAEEEMCAKCVLNAYIRFCKEKLTRNAHPFTISVACNSVDSFGVLSTVFDEFVMEGKKAEEATSNNDDSRSTGATGYRSDENINTFNNSKMDAVKQVEHDCVICMDTATEPKELICGHVFCTECIDQHFTIKQTCPTCGAICGIITGDQPNGDMSVMWYDYKHCAGYEKYGQIAITYSFPQGRQGDNHPQPGNIYKGMIRTAYLPNNEKGRKVLKMLKIAFERKLIFTIGRSVTTGEEGVITWNDIHHKTDHRYGKQFGYPDHSYLDRVTAELAAKGVTEKDVE